MLKYQTIPDILESYPGSSMFLLRSKAYEIFWFHIGELPIDGEYEVLGMLDESET